MVRFLELTALHRTIDGCNSWSDVQQSWRGLSEKQKGDLFEQLVSLYLVLDPLYATKLKNVWLYRDVPVSIATKLRLPHQDQGIDLIVETHDGEFWAIQCKYRDNTNRSLTWREVSTFAGLTFAVCRGISFGIICSTTERMTHVLSEQERIGFCALDVWQGLTADFFARAKARLGQQPEFIQPLVPRPHQEKAVSDAVRHFLLDRQIRGKLIMPCGTGKSLTAYWISQDLEARRILIAVPSLALVRQTLTVWLREAIANGETFEWICVCSDESVTNLDRDDLTVFRQDLGIPCFTTSTEIAAWLRKHVEANTMVFTTYQSGDAICEAAQQARFQFDLGVMDEAHKTVGATGKLFSRLLHDANVSIRRRIFMTATERRYRGESDSVLSMDDPATYGETFHLLTFKNALEFQPPILADYKLLTIFVDRDDVAELVAKNIFVKPTHEEWNPEHVEIHMLASLIALRKAMNKYPIRHVVSFHSSIKRATRFARDNEVFSRAFPEYGNVDGFHVSGKTPTGTRSRITTDFVRTDRALITNARCLTEGVDIPEIDGVLFADPRRSTVDIVQAIGRALRPGIGKKYGYVIVPVLHSRRATAEELFATDEFKEVLTVLRALGATDDRIIDYFKTVSLGKQLHNGVSIEFDVGEKLAQPIDVNELSRIIHLRCWERLAKLAWRPFVEARHFARALKLKSENQWRQFCRGKLNAKGALPEDVPTSPDKTYAKKGWVGWGDWLGTGTIAPRLKRYRPFVDARVFAQSLDLQTRADWINFCKGKLSEKGKLPIDVPASPSKTYANRGWAGWGDWLGTGNVANFLRCYRPFEKARAYARSLDLQGQAEWRKFCKGELRTKGILPKDIPANPNASYAKKGWINFGDWLGTGRVAPRLRSYRPFVEARAFARALGLKTAQDWVTFCNGNMPDKGKLPPGIPFTPRHVYAHQGWVSMGDWLGTDYVARALRKYRSFADAREYVHKLGLRSQNEWIRYCKGAFPEKGTLPQDIPADPGQMYAKNGWAGMGDWLGTGTIAPRLRQYRSFEDARNFARTLNLRGESEWRRFCAGQLSVNHPIPLDVPRKPDRRYAGKGWAGWGDWLGTGTISYRRRNYRSFKEARAFAAGLALGSRAEWTKFCQGGLPEKGSLPFDVPHSPDGVYQKRGWIGWGDWLGTGAVAFSRRRYRKFENAREFARAVGLSTHKEWSAFCRGELREKGILPVDIPANPNQTYARAGWAGWGDWLGTGAISVRFRQYRTFEEARDFAGSLNLGTFAEWQKFCRGALPIKGKLPLDIPASPEWVYADKGWLGFGDWLGSGRIANFRRQYRSFDAARTFARSLSLRSYKEWTAFCKGKFPGKAKLPQDIPTHADRTYADKGWSGWGDWLDTGNKPCIKRATAART